MTDSTMETHHLGILPEPPQEGLNVVFLAAVFFVVTYLDMAQVWSTRKMKMMFRTRSGFCMVLCYKKRLKQRFCKSKRKTVDVFFCTRISTNALHKECHISGYDVPVFVKACQVHFSNKKQIKNRPPI